MMTRSSKCGVFLRRIIARARRAFSSLALVQELAEPGALVTRPLVRCWLPRAVSGSSVAGNIGSLQTVANHEAAGAVARNLHTFPEAHVGQRSSST